MLLAVEDHISAEQMTRQQEAAPALRKRTRTEDPMIFKDHPDEDYESDGSGRNGAVMDSAWSDASGAFWHLQCRIRERWPELSFRNEFCDPQNGQTSCRVIGFAGELSELAQMEEEGVTFEIQDNRLLLILDPYMAQRKHEINRVKRLMKFIEYGWFVLLLLTFILFGSFGQNYFQTDT